MLGRPNCKSLKGMLHTSSVKIDMLFNKVAKTDLAILFWTGVNRGYPNECWNWLGATTKQGHGITSVWFADEERYRMKPVSHVAVYLTLGFWPARPVKRTCGNSVCVNLNHFKLD